MVCHCLSRRDTTLIEHPIISDHEVNKDASATDLEAYDQQAKSVKEGLISDIEGSYITLEGDCSRV